jgi:hypothetical protein
MDILFKNMKEKRKHPRLNLLYPIHCHSLKSSTSFYSEFENISNEGLKLVTDDLLDINESIKFEINLVGKSVKGEGKIVWHKSFQNKKRYTAGVKFTKLEPTNQRFLSKFLLDMLET